MTESVTVTDNSFDAQILKCDIPVVTEFLASWSKPGRKVASHLQEIAAEYNEQLKVVKVDIELSPTMTSNYEVLNIPTVIIFKNGQEVERVTGPWSKEALLEKITPFLDE